MFAVLASALTGVAYLFATMIKMAREVKQEATSICGIKYSGIDAHATLHEMAVAHALLSKCMATRREFLHCGANVVTLSRRLRRVALSMLEADADWHKRKSKSAKEFEIFFDFEESRRASSQTKIH